MTIEHSHEHADVTIIIPHIPIREEELKRAVKSVYAQTLLPADAIVMPDANREGSAVMRNRAIQGVTTEWVAFLDDDDELFPNHFEVLFGALKKVPDVDVIYTGCRVYDARGFEIPRRMEWGRFMMPFDADLLRKKSYLPVTSMVRTSLAKQVEFARHNGTAYDDWGFYLALLDNGATFYHEPVVTWRWNHHGKNTQGLPTKW